MATWCLSYVSPSLFFLPYYVIFYMCFMPVDILCSIPLALAGQMATPSAPSANSGDLAHRSHL